MKMMTVLGISLLLFVGCKEDKNMEDYRREQLEQSIARISSVSGNYSGPMISSLDGTSLGDATLKFQARTQVLSQSGGTISQSVSVSGSLTVKGATNSEIVFTDGFYDDISGKFQVTIPFKIEGLNDTNISIEGTVHGDSWSGTIEVLGHDEYKGVLNLLKNAPLPNSSSVEVQGTRLQQIQKMSYVYEGQYTVGGTTSPMKLTFIDKDMLPIQNIYKLFSPVRTIAVNIDFTDFELYFNNAIINDHEGTLKAGSSIDQRGNNANTTLDCTKFEVPTGFGWNCKIQTKVEKINVRLNAKR